MVNPLDRDETSGRRQRTGLRALEDIAIESGVPANLLVAIGEHAPDSESAVRMARELAAEYSPRIRAGEDIQAILRAEAPDHAEAIIGRARQIGEQLYPDQMRSAREAAERAAQERRANEPGIVGDFGRSVGAGVVEGLGSAVEGAGVLLDQPLSLIRGDETYQPGMLARAGAAVGDAARGVGEGLREGMSEDSRRAMADSTPDGNLFDPSTYSMGDNPTFRGYIMHFGSVLGSLASVIATGVAGRVAGLGGRASAVAGGAVGGAQAAGDGAGTAAGIIEEVYRRRGADGRSELEAASPLFQELRAQGRSEEEAFAAVRDEAMRFGAMLQAPIGAASGAFMGLAARGLNPVINRLPGGPMSRALQAGLATAFEEGASEAAEGMAARYGAQVGSGMDVDETQETFGNFVLGALGGGPVGAVSGLASPRTGGRDDEETQETGQGLVSPQPAAPGGASQGAERTPADLPNFNATGRDEQGPARGELVRVQIRGERGAWDGEIIGESEEGIEVRSRTGETLLFPRADLDSGDVILTRAGRSTSTPAARRGAPDLGLGLEPEAEAAGEARPLTADDARRFLDAIEARARRVGWDDDMRATAAQLKDAIDRGTPIPASITENPALAITKRDGAPFGDEASARRALGKLGVSVGGYDIVPVEGGYVARPKLDIRNEPMAGGGGTGPLGIDDGGRSRRAQLGVEPDVRDGRANSGQQPAFAQDRGGVPDAVARGEPDAALNEQQDVQLGGNADYQGRQVQVTQEGPWDFSSSFPEPDRDRLRGRLEQGRDDGIDSPEAVVATLDETLADLTDRVAGAIAWAEDARRIERGEKPVNKIPKGQDPLAYARQQGEAAARDADDQASALADVWPDSAVDAVRKEALRRAREALSANSKPQFPNAASDAEVARLIRQAKAKEKKEKRRAAYLRTRTLKWPLAAAIVKRGGIAPRRFSHANQAWETSFLAQELAAQDITPRSHPQLFRKGGLTNLDNIPVGELGPDDAVIFGTDPNGTYLDQQALLDQLIKEVTTGKASYFDIGEEQERVEAQENEEERIRAEEIGAEVDDYLSRHAFRLIEGEKEAIISRVYDGEAVDEATYAVMERTAIQMEGTYGRGEARDLADGEEPSDLGEVPFGDEPRARTGSDDAGGAAGSDAAPGERAETGGRGQAGRDGSAVPGGVTQTGLAKALNDAKTRGTVEHVTKKGKTLRGYVVRGDFSTDDIKTIDPYTFRKDGGFFIRENTASVTPEQAVSTEAQAEPQPAPQFDAAERARKKAARLAEVAENAIAKATEDRDRPRQDNTARRARMAAGAEADAQKRIDRARTLKAVADMVLENPASPLASILSLADIDRIEGELVRARSTRIARWDYAERREVEGSPFGPDDAAAVPQPYVLVRPQVGNTLIEAVKGKRGIDRNRLRSIESNTRDTYQKVSQADTIEAIKGALSALRAAGPLAYDMKGLSESVTDYEALTRIFGGDRAAFFDAYLGARADAGGAVQDPMRKIRRDLIGVKIPGFFETPEALARRVVDEADLSAGDRVLEPSAGLGRIANAAAAVVGKANVDVVEVNSRLRAALEAQGFNVVADDFTEFDGEGYDAIVMNPPFEDRQDAEHVMRAFDMLKPGGRLVAIMGEGVFFGRDSRAVEFRNWLYGLGGRSEQLPEGTFKESGTGTNTRFVTVTRPAEVMAEPDFAPFEVVGMTPPRAGGEVARFLRQEMPDSTTRVYKVRPVKRDTGYHWLVRRDVITNSQVTNPPTKDLGTFAKAADAIKAMADDGMRPAPARDVQQEEQRATEEPGAEGLPQAVIPGTERSDAQARQSMTDRQRGEMAARQQQSKMRRLNGGSAAPGPLFDDGPADLFAEPKSPAKPDGLPVAAAAQETDPNPTLAQAEAENYKTGKADWNGLTLSIENAKGSTRRGTGPDGTEWSVKMPAHYGRILGTKGADGDHVDFYMGDMESSDFVVIVNQVDPDTGAFDEHKVVLGTGSRAEALRLYEAGFSDGRGRERIGSDTATTVAGFKAWLESGDMSKPTQPVKPAPSDRADDRPRDTSDELKRLGRAWDAMTDAARQDAVIASRLAGVNRDGGDGQVRWLAGRKWADLNKTQQEALAWEIPDPRKAAPQFPTTLEDITAGVRRQRANERLSHIYAEYRGQRFYLASVSGNPDAPAAEWRKTFPGASIYTTDRADGTSINGDSAALEAAIAARDSAKKGGEVQLTPPSQTAPKAKIEDFGEKIGGAKKDVWSGYAQKMAEAENFDLAKDPLSKTWPEPDYEALVRDGVDAWSVGFVRAARDAIPRKPSSSWKVKQWVEQVRLLRGLARQVLSGDHSRETIEGKMVGSVSLQRMQNTIALYETFGHAKSLKGLTFRAAQYSVYGGVRYPQAKVIWEITKEQKATAFSNMPRVLASGDTREQAIEAFRPVHAAMTAEGDTRDQAKADRRAKFVIWTQRTDSPKTYYVGVKIGTNHVALRSGITESQEAHRIVAEEADQLQAQLDKMRDIPSERRDTNEPRVGSDHRGGIDVTPAMFADAFGFRGVEFGNYVEDKRRQEDLNNAYDALMDLAGIIGVPSKALSLNGTLGLAFGARGSGGKNAYAAHFEPGKIVINLTKTKGRGSLAHEWFHALDNYFARMREPMRGNFITDNASAANTAGGLPVIVGIRPEVIDAFLSVRSAINKTNLPQRSRRLDKMRTSPYYGTGTEMHARAFESYVVAKLQDQGGANDYLANLVGEDFWEALSAMSGRPAETYPYLRPDEIEAVRPAFDALFRTIETKQTESGVAMYSRRKTPLYSATLRAAEGLTMAKGTGPQFLSMLTNTPGVKPEELDWIGLRDFLRGKDRVTRDEVVAFIRENQVQVVEHRKGGATDPDEVRPSAAVIARHQESWDLINAEIARLDRELGPLKRAANREGTLEAEEAAEEAQRRMYAMQDQREALNEQMVAETIEEMGGLADETKFEDWRTPGGQQYRELLLAMQSNAPRFGVFQGERMVLPREYATAAEAREAARQMGFEGRATVRELDGKNRNADTFKSSHWSEPNVLAHIRFDERAVQVPLTDEQRRQNERRAQLQAEFDRLTWEIGEAVRQTVAERKPIEDRIKAEVRADMLAGKVRPGDYMQEVINRTYDLPPTPGMIRQRELGEQRAALGLPSEAKPTSERSLFIQEIQSDWHQAGRKKGYRPAKSAFEVFRMDTGATVQWVNTKEEAERIVTETKDENGKVFLDYMPPELQDNKSNVPDAPLKRTWHETAFRRAVAWAVEHGYDSVTWATGEMNAELFDLSQQISSLEWTWHPDTKEVEVQAETPGGEPLSMWRDQETLDEAVGKEMANRIISEINAGKTTNTYRGLDLKVGGEGMAGFYDKIIPNYAAKWGKRFGASVGRVMIPVNDPGRGVRQITAPAWHMPITDSMRATVQMEGVALFKRGEAPAEVVGAKAEAVKADLERAWHRLGLPDSVRLRLVDRLFGMDPDGNTVPVDGSYIAGLVRVALDSSEGSLATLHHEAIHALRDPVMWGQPYGLFTEGEWSALEAEAGRSWLAKHRIAETYPDLTPAEQIEEAIAAEFAAMSRAGSEPETAPLRRALRKVLAFFKAFGRALRGAGVQDADGVFGKVMSGEVGRRGGAAERNTDGTFASHAVKYSRRVLAGDGPVTAQAERGVVGQMLTDAMGGKSSRYSILALVPGEPLYQELAKNIASARTYLSLKHAMSAMRNKMQAEAAKTMDDWRGFMVRNRKSNDALMDLMHDATKAGLDPAAPFSVRKRQARETQAEYDVFVEGRRVEYAALKARWDALPAKAKGIYRKVRDSYVEVAKTEREIIEQNIKDAMDINLKRARQAYEDELTRIDEDGLEGDERMAAEEAAAETYSAVKRRDGYGRASRLRSLRLMLEGNQVDAPYFPLLRHGQYFVTVKDKNGKIVSFTKAESEREQARIASAARAEFGPDHDITTGLMGAQDAAPDVDPMFVADVEELIGSKVDDPALMDAIWQRYLETLPDFSMRKSRLHRKGTPGYSRDAFRAFARQMFHSAHQLARLKHGMKMQMALDDAQREAQRAEDPNRAMAVVNEMGLRHDWIMNPKSAAWSTWATSAAFVYYLGMTPAAALVNLSQTVVVGIPVLAAGFKNGGALRASRQLMRALKEFGTGLGAVEKAKTLTDDERAAIRDAYDRGIVDKSQAHDLAGAAEAGVEYSDIRQRIMAPISFFFHHAERLNREITFLAAYRMARADGMAHPEAIDKAGALTWKTHFNYESDSRPRVQQNDFMRVATVFRNFQLNMLYRLFRDIHQTFKGRTAEDRQEARAQLFGITGIMALSAGVTGTWGYSLLMTLAGMFVPGADADDLEKEIKNALVNTLGQDLAGIILHGVPGHLTGINLTSRIGMPELWFRSPDRQMEGDDLYNYWAQQFLGAVPGMAQNIFRGVDLAAGGDIWRGMETASPKFIRDLMRGVRYSQDGVTTISGNTILESVPPMDALVQALGFTPAQISERYEQNRWMMNENTQIQNARSAALTSVWRDVRDGGEISERTRAQIDAFNAENPDYVIDAATIRRSVQSRRRGAEDTVGGIRLNNRIEGRIRANAPVSIYGAAP